MMEQRKLCGYSYLATTRCNCRCRHCTPKLYEGCNREELTSAELIQQYEESYFLQNNSVSVAGGEPFLKEDLEEFILYLDQKKIPCIITTNGWFTDKIEKLSRQLSTAETVRFSISVDGIGRVHDDIRGLKGIYNRALESIKLLKDKGFGVQVNCVAQKANLHQISEMKELFGGMNVPLNIVPKVKTGTEAFEYDEEQVRKLYPHTNLAREKKYLLSKGRYVITSNCHAGKNYWLLDANGDIYTCCGGYYKENSEKYFIDNLRNKSFDQIILSSEAQEVCKDIVQKCEGCISPCEIEREVTVFGYSTEYEIEDVKVFKDTYAARCCMEDINCDNYNWNGLESDAVGGYRWMKRKSASVFLKVPQKYSVVCIAAWNLMEHTSDGGQPWISCAVDGKELGRKWCVLGEEEYTFLITDLRLEPEELVKVTICTNLAWIPKEAGMGEDYRTLGLAVRSVEIKE